MKSANVIMLMTTLTIAGSQMSFCDEDPFAAVILDMSDGKLSRNPHITDDLHLLSVQEDNNSECLSAKITLALYLLDRDTTNMSKQELREPYQLCRQIIKDNSKTWQAELARFLIVLEPTLDGDTSRHLELVDKELSEIDLVLLEETDDRVLNAIRHIYLVEDASTFKDALYLMKASALCDQDMFEEAEKTTKKIKTEKYKHAVRARIETKKTIHKDR